MSQKLIRKCFERRATAWAAALTPPLPLAFQNASFVPPAPPTEANRWGRYARVAVVPGNTDSRDLEGKHREYVGLFQVTLVLPLNKGANEGTELAESLDAAFPVGPPLVQDGFNIWVTTPMSEGPPLSEADRVNVPVSASYKAERFLSP